MTRPVRIPSDVNRPDRVVGPLTARQAAILAATAAVLYLLWTVLRGHLPDPVLIAGAIPVAALAAVLALGQRDGLSLDRLLLAALRHRLAPRAPASDPGRSHAGLPDDDVPEWISAGTSVPDKPSPGRGRRLTGFPARAVTAGVGGRAPGGVGVVDLGADGLVVIVVVSTVNFALRTPAEQDGLVAGFARYLHTLGGPVQILVRALPVDLHSHLQRLHTETAELPHPALAAAAHDHLQHLARLARGQGEHQLLTRQVLLVVREPHRSTVEHRERGRGAGEARLLRRLHDAATLLGALDITVTALDAAQTTALLTNTCNPDTCNPDTGHSRHYRGRDDDYLDGELDHVIRSTAEDDLDVPHQNDRPPGDDLDAHAPWPGSEVDDELWPAEPAGSPGIGGAGRRWPR